MKCNVVNGMSQNLGCANAPETVPGMCSINLDHMLSSQALGEACFQPFTIRMRGGRKGVVVMQVVQVVQILVFNNASLCVQIELRSYSHTL